MKPRLAQHAEDLQATLTLVQREFAYMDGIIDPPSSVHTLTIEDLAQDETWVIGSPPEACIRLTKKPDALYVSKLAVARSARGKGYARTLINLAMARAREQLITYLELQCRIELTSNHAAFEKMGFTEVARTAHTGYDRPTSITFRRKS